MLDGEGQKRKKNDVEGFALLSEQERKLCSELALIPQHYMIIKERLIRLVHHIYTITCHRMVCYACIWYNSESYTRGFLVASQTQQLIQIDINKTSKLLDFFVAVGWVNSAPAVPTPTSSLATSVATGHGSAATAAASLLTSSSLRTISTPNGHPVTR
jgi:hypothetical protein